MVIPSGHWGQLGQLRLTGHESLASLASDLELLDDLAACIAPCRTPSLPNQPSQRQKVKPEDKPRAMQ